MSAYSRNIRNAVQRELASAREAEHRGLADVAFHHLERAHVLGQNLTSEHVRVHFQMLCWGARQRSFREVTGQIARLVGAATKTAVGWVPTGNTGGSNVSPFRPMTIEPELQSILDNAKGIAKRGTAKNDLLGDQRARQPGPFETLQRTGCVLARPGENG